MKEKVKAVPVYLLLMVDRHPNYNGRPRLEIKATPVRMESDRQVPRNISSGFGEEHTGLADLMVSGWTDAEWVKGGDERLLTTRLCYDQPHRVELERAKEMAAKLTAIHKGLKAVEAKMGPPSTFAEEVIRLGVVLKVENYVRKVEPKVPGGHLYSDFDWRWMDAGDAVYWINATLRKFVDECKPAQEATA